MGNRSTVRMAALLLLLVPSVAAGSELVTFESYLASRGLSRSDVKCINPQTEDVLNGTTRDWDRGQTVCEVWVNEKVTPAERLTFKDGAQVFMATRRWTTEVQEPREVERSGDFVVREDSKQEQTTATYKRYVIQ